MPGAGCKSCVPFIRVILILLSNCFILLNTISVKNPIWILNWTKEAVKKTAPFLITCRGWTDSATNVIIKTKIKILSRSC